MSDPLDRIQALADAARDEYSPVGDVSARTIAAIRMPRERWFNHPMAVCAAAYGVVCLVGVSAAYYWYTTAATDPLAGFLSVAADIAP